MMMIRLTDSATLSAAGGFLDNSLSLIAKLTKTVKKTVLLVVIFLILMQL